MDLRGVPPWQLERIWADEVLHLHSLWHLGPTPSPNPNPNPNLNLRPIPSSSFKKQAKKKTKRKQWDYSNGGSAHSSEPADSGKEWPCPPQPDPKPSPETWADLDAAAAEAAQLPKPPPSAEELARAAATLAQYNGVRTSRSFFSKRKRDDDNEEDAEEDDDDDDMDVDEGESDQSGTCFKFFFEIFESDGALRQYYEKNCERGEFACLVCEGIGKKGKRFGSCVGLVQHSNSISKTRRRGAHRAFARAVCRVLGWDMKRLPSIVLVASDSLGQSSAKAANAKEGTEKKDSSSQEEVSGNKEEIPKEVTNKENAAKKDSSSREEASGNTEEPLAKKDFSSREEVSGNTEEPPKGVTEKEGCHDDSTNFVETKETTKLRNKEVSDNKEELSNDIAEALKINKGDQINDLLEETNDEEDGDPAI